MYTHNTSPFYFSFNLFSENFLKEEEKRRKRKKKERKRGGGKL